jgi:tetratricopeptide (TPR) repeat protein
MREKTIYTTTSTALLAALLAFSPTAQAATKSKKTKDVKLDKVAARLMSEGMGDLNRGEVSAAISLFAHAARRQPSVQAYFLLGWAHYQRGFKQGTVEQADRDDAQSAIDAYEMALSKDQKLAELPDRSRLYFSMGLCEEAVQSYQRALNSYKMALASAPSKALIPLNAARLRLKMNDPEKALSNVQMAMIKARAAGQEAALRSAAKNDPAFAALISNEQIRETLGVKEDKMVASADMRDADMRDSVSDMPRVAPPAPGNPAVLDKISQGDVEAKFRRYAEAIRDYRAALDADRSGRTLSAVDTASVWEKIGVAENKTGDCDAAIAALQKSLQLAPNSAEAHYQIALAYATSGKTSTALHSVKEAFASAGGSAELRRYLLLSKTDSELSAVRDLPGYASAVSEITGKVALR